MDCNFMNLFRNILVIFSQELLFALSKMSTKKTKTISEMAVYGESFYKCVTKIKITSSS